MTSPNNANIADTERVFAGMKSYIGPSILVFFLYLLFYVPGLITNYIFRKEAKRMEKLAGQKLPGTGCLGFMFWLNILNIPLLVLTLVALLFYAVGKTIYKQFTSRTTIKELVKTVVLITLVTLVFVGISNAWEITQWTWTPEGGSPLTVFSWGTDDEYIREWRIEMIGSVGMGFIAAALATLGIWKNGWINALIATLKRVAANFTGALADFWKFVNAEERTREAIPEIQ